YFFIIFLAILFIIIFFYFLFTNLKKGNIAPVTKILIDSKIPIEDYDLKIYRISIKGNKYLFKYDNENKQKCNDLNNYKNSWASKEGWYKNIFICFSNNIYKYITKIKINIGEKEFVFFEQEFKSNWAEIKKFEKIYITLRLPEDIEYNKSSLSFFSNVKNWKGDFELLFYSFHDAFKYILLVLFVIFLFFFFTILIKRVYKKDIDIIFLYLIIIYIFFSLVRFLISLLIKEPIVMLDELYYKGMAYSFFKTGDFYNLKFGNPRLSNFLYQLVISHSFFFENNFHVIIKFINSFIIHFAIFPIFLLLKEFVEAKKALIFSIIILFISFFNMNIFIMSENLFFPLFWLTFYFVYRFFTMIKVKDAILIGILLSFMFLTKPQALFFIYALIIIGAFIFFYYWDNKKKKKGLFFSLILVIAFFLSFILINMIFIKDFTIKNIFGFYSGVKNAAFKNAIFNKFYLKRLFYVILSHFSTFLFLYLIPFFV
ncbi:MAG: glycosyltransferase family 39 protein, partial [Spirochaetes bacterium]|nr:glycosyltransferase family 39 protein [Spirochaetota bacterium]